MNAAHLTYSLRNPCSQIRSQKTWFLERPVSFKAYDMAFDGNHPSAKPLRVGLLNAYSSRNLGDAAIMTALAALVPGNQVTAQLRDSQPIPMKGVACADSFEPADRFISVGGDIFNNSRPWLATRAFVRNVLALAAAGSRGILFGQTVPTSCRGAALISLSLAMRRLSGVVVRDQESYELLRRYGVDAKLSFDSAFAIEATEAGRARARQLLEAASIEPSRAALISVRSFDAMYPSNQEKTEQKLATLSRRLAQRGHEPAILIQSDVNAADSDWAAAQRLRAMVPELKIIDCVNQPDDPAPVDTLIGLLAIANIAVGLRYHTTALRLTTGRSAFNLYYSRKGCDLSRRLHLPGIHIDDFDADRDLCAIENASARAFDVSPVAKHVKTSFRQAYGALK